MIQLLTITAMMISSILSTTGLNFDDLTVTQQGDDVLISSVDGNSILLLDTDAANIDAGALNVTASGRNWIDGTAENDTLLGTMEDETLSGNGGSDVFRFDSNWGSDVIDDFDPDNDRLDFSGSGADLYDLAVNSYQSGDDIIVADGSGNSVTLKNLSLDDVELASLFSAPPGVFNDQLEVDSPSGVSQTSVIRNNIPEVTALSNGGYAVTWTNEPVALGPKEIFTRVFDADGEAVTDAFQVSREGGYSQNYEAFSLPGGGYAITWYDIWSDVDLSRNHLSIYDNNGNGGCGER